MTHQHVHPCCAARVPSVHHTRGTHLDDSGQAMGESYYSRDYESKVHTSEDIQMSSGELGHQFATCTSTHTHNFFLYSSKISVTFIDVEPGWEWANHPGRKMTNNVASTFQVDFRLQCMTNCTLSPICDSYNYRPSDKTCELNTHDTPLVANSADVVTDSAWTWWSPIFCKVVVV